MPARALTTTIANVLPFPRVSTTTSRPLVRSTARAAYFSSRHCPKPLPTSASTVPPAVTASTTQFPCSEPGMTAIASCAQMTSTPDQYSQSREGTPAARAGSSAVW